MNDGATARVRADGPGQVRVHLRGEPLVVRDPIPLDDAAVAPSALELLLGALGADLIALFSAELHRRRVDVDDVELRLSGRLDNALLVLGVVGETGSPRLAAVDGTLFVTGAGDPAAVEDVWALVARRSPVLATLEGTVAVSIEVRTML